MAHRNRGYGMDNLLFGIGAALVGLLLIALGVPWWIPAGISVPGIFGAFE